VPKNTRYESTCDEMVRLDREAEELLLADIAERGKLSGKGAPTVKLNDPLEPSLSRKEAAKIIGTTVETLSRMAARGDGPACYNIGRRVRYTPASIRRYMAGRTK
jgi:hypothetical protein